MAAGDVVKIAFERPHSRRTTARSRPVPDGGHSQLSGTPSKDRRSIISDRTITKDSYDAQATTLPRQTEVTTAATADVGGVFFSLAAKEEGWQAIGKA